MLLHHILHVTAQPHLEIRGVACLVQPANGGEGRLRQSFIRFDISALARKENDDEAGFPVLRLKKIVFELRKSGGSPRVLFLELLDIETVFAIIAQAKIESGMSDLAFHVTVNLLPVL
jgi:hypothetical protein